MTTRMIAQLSLPPLGGGGMAQESLLERLLLYAAWGLFVLIACPIAAAILRRLYGTPASRTTAGTPEADRDDPDGR